YLTQRVRSLVRFSLSQRYKSLAPEKRSNTQILRAIPEKFVTSGIEFSDLAPESVGDLTVLRRENISGQQERRAMGDSGGSETEIDEAITVTDYADFDDENAHDARLVLISTDGSLTYTLRRRLTRIGRNIENDIVLDSDRVSRYHAE